jgi:hypothetical protein
VEDLILAREQYLLRYPPDGRRSVLYRRAKVDHYAKYIHAQGLVLRITLYLDNERQFVNQIHEWFENRKDKLHKRSRYPLETKAVQYFRPGAVVGKQNYCSNTPATHVGRAGGRQAME